MPVGGDEEARPVASILNSVGNLEDHSANHLSEGSDEVGHWGVRPYVRAITNEVIVV